MTHQQAQLQVDLSNLMCEFVAAGRGTPADAWAILGRAYSDCLLTYLHDVD